jgi:hypothetical protein
MNIASQRGDRASVRELQVSAFTIPTSSPEADGTLSWNSTTLVLVELEAAGQRGIGYTYADTATAKLIDDTLRHIIEGHDAMAVTAAWEAMATWGGRESAPWPLRPWIPLCGT